MKILVAEDEPKVAQFIQKALSQALMNCDIVHTYPDLEHLVEMNEYDILILDRILYKYDTLTKIKKIKELSPNSKILFLSALTDIDQKVDALNTGADDYMVKPFHISELLARIKILAKRGENQINHSLTFKDLSINLDSQKVSRNHQKIDLSAKEYKILCLFCKHPERVFTKAELLDRVWDMNFFPESNLIEVTIANLRNKIDKDFSEKLIQSKRGIGYWLG